MCWDPAPGGNRQCTSRSKGPTEKMSPVRNKQLDDGTLFTGVVPPTDRRCGPSGVTETTQWTDTNQDVEDAQVALLIAANERDRNQERS